MGGSPDEVFGQADPAAEGGLHLRLLQDDEGGVPYVLVEGNAAALDLLGQLVRRVAAWDADDASIQLGPDRAGSHWFDASSELGIYVNRTGPTR